MSIEQQVQFSFVCHIRWECLRRPTNLLMGSGSSHIRGTEMNPDKHLRDLLLEKTSEVQRLKSENERYAKL